MVKMQLDTSQFEKAISQILAGHGPVAVDAERASGFTYSAKAYLIQIFRRDGGLLNFHGDLINQFKDNGMLHWDTIVMENITPFAAMQLYKVNCKRFTSKYN